MNTEQVTNQPKYVAWTKYHYSALVGLISDVVVTSVDHAGEIAIRALPVVAPLPNAIGMYKTSMDALHFSQWQAFLFAAAIEISIFALAEIAVVMWDSWQAGDALYKLPFRLMAGVTGFVAILIIVLVATLEVYGASGHWILATLPLISVASAVGLCMKRFHKRRQESKISTDAVSIAMDAIRKDLSQVRNELGDERKSAEDADRKLKQAVAELDSERKNTEELRAQLEDVRIEAEKARSEIRTVDTDSVLNRLDDGSRAVLIAILKAINGNRVTNPADAAKLTEANKTKVYEMFRLAEVTNAIYKNGDGAYHVR